MEKTGSRRDIPKGAVILSRREAYMHMLEKVWNHQPESDVILLKYGGLLVGAMSSIAGIIWLKHFRKGFGLRKEGQISSTLACTSLPAMSTFLYHQLFTQSKILLEDNVCAVCLELQALAIQVVAGVIVPCGMGYVAANMTAMKLGMCVPGPAQPKEFIKLGYQLVNNTSGMYRMGGLAAISFLGTILLIQAEQIQLVTFKRRLLSRRVLQE